jgi:hypothetical protein
MQSTNWGNQGKLAIDGKSPVELVATCYHSHSTAPIARSAIYFLPISIAFAKQANWLVTNYL